MAARIKQVLSLVHRLRWTKPLNHFHRSGNRFAKCNCIFVGEWLGR